MYREVVEGREFIGGAQTMMQNGKGIPVMQRDQVIQHVEALHRVPGSILQSF